MIWHKGPRTVLELLLSSTADKFYVTEILRETGLAPATVISVLEKLKDAKLVIREDERPNFDSVARAPRVYYSLTPSAVTALRLTSPSA